MFAVLVMRPYVKTSATEPGAVADAVSYGRIVCIGSLGTFLEGNWTKVHQSRGNMRLPMAAQILGALTNCILDPILIFGAGPIKAMGVSGAAYATVAGQVLAAVITGVKGYRKPPKLKRMLYYAGRIYHYGYSSIIMQLLYTVYILLLNIILSGFSDAAVTVLSGIATWWLAKSYPQQWLLWVVADVVSAWLCWSQGMIPMAILYAIYSISAIYGYIHWIRNGRYID